MKHLMFATVSAFVLASFISCKKDSSTPLTGESTLSKLKSLEARYQKTGDDNTLQRPWQQYAAADAIGGLETAGWGGSVAGPWGALCGGIAGGVFASCALDMFDKVVPNTDNPTPGGDNPPMPSLPVGVLEPAVVHNEMLHHFLLDAGSYVYDDGTVNLDLLKQACVQQVSARYAFDVSMLEQIAASTDYATIVSYAENPPAYFESMGDNLVRDAAESFYNTAFAIDERSDLEAYYAQFVPIIVDAGDMTDTEKIRVLSFAGIGTASLLYHGF